MLAAFRNQDRF